MSDTDYRKDDLTDEKAIANAKPGEEPATSHDVGEGGVLGAVGGAIVGALAGGPIGAVIGAIAGGAASAGAVSVVDKHDHDYDRTAGTTGTVGTTVGATGTGAYDATDTTYGAAGTGVTAGTAYPETATTGTGYGATGTGYGATEADAMGRNTTAATATDGTVIPIVEEQLTVGKREVQHGGAVVHTGVIETPVQEQVMLREEHVTVDRRPVDRAATGMDTAFQDGVIEVTETDEEAVIAKNARVVEEVVVGKTATERTETVRDTVRRTDVQVEEIPGATKTTDPYGTTR